MLTAHLHMSYHSADVSISAVAHLQKRGKKKSRRFYFHINQYAVVNTFSSNNSSLAEAKKTFELLSGCGATMESNHSFFNIK